MLGGRAGVDMGGTTQNVLLDYNNSNTTYTKKPPPPEPPLYSVQRRYMRSLRIFGMQ